VTEIATLTRRIERRTVLVVEDNAEWRDAITRILEIDFEVIGYVEHGDEIVTIARNLRPDLVTLDVSIPGLSGLMALPELRAELPSAGIVILTTISSKPYVEEAFRRGADGYVLKNRALRDLIPALASAGSRTESGFGTPNRLRPDSATGSVPLS